MQKTQIIEAKALLQDLSQEEVFSRVILDSEDKAYRFSKFGSVWVCGGTLLGSRICVLYNLPKNQSFIELTEVQRIASAFAITVVVENSRETNILWEPKV